MLLNEEPLRSFEVKVGTIQAMRVTPTKNPRLALVKSQAFEIASDIEKDFVDIAILY